MTHAFFVTMNFAITAGWFALLKRTMNQSFLCITEKILAIRAENVIMVCVVSLAVDVQHRCDGFKLISQAFVSKLF